MRGAPKERARRSEPFLIDRESASESDADPVRIVGSVAHGDGEVGGRATKAHAADAGDAGAGVVSSAAARAAVAEVLVVDAGRIGRIPAVGRERDPAAVVVADGIRLG